MMKTNLFPQRPIHLASFVVMVGLALVLPEVGLSQAKPVKKKQPTERQLQHFGPQNPFASEQTSIVMRSRGRLGAQVISMSPELRAYFGAPKNQGLLVDRVAPDSPALKAGLKSGDVIIAVKGKPIDKTSDIFEALRPLKKGDKVKLKIIRDKKTLTLEAVLDSDGHSSMQWRGQGPGQFDFDFDFPNKFRVGPMEKNKNPWFQFDPKGLQEKVRELEERIKKLEKAAKRNKRS
jgi:membrane-associated protease RseP (regulator of RpoE activity)